MAALFNAAGSGGNGNNATTLSWTHVLGDVGGNGLIVVVVESENPSDNISSVTFNGTAMTLVNNAGQGTGHGCWGRLYELHGASVPAAGSYTVTANFSTFSGGGPWSSTGGSMSFSGVKRQAAESSATNTANTGTTISQAITTLTANALVVVGYGSQNTPTTTVNGTGETSAFRALPGSGEQSESDGFYKTVVTAGSTNTSLTTSNPETEFIILASFEVAPATGGAAIFPAFF